MNIYDEYYKLFLIENDDEMIENFLKLQFTDPVIMRYKKMIENNMKEI